MYTPRAASPLAQCLRCSVPWVGSSTRKWSGTSAGSPVGKGYMWYDTPPLAGLPLRYRKYLWSNQLNFNPSPSSPFIATILIGRILFFQ
jgi:hypothetical protein